MAHKKRGRQEETAYWTGAHTTHRLRVHLVRAPECRRRVLGGPVAARLGELIRRAAEVNRWRVRELATQPGHIHLLLQMRPPENVSPVVNCLEGGTSRVLHSEFPDLEQSLWGDGFWADGYLAESVGQVEEAVVSRYIRQQQR